MSHFSKGVVKRVTLIMRDLSELVSVISKQGDLKHELGEVLSYENCWVGRHKVALLWIPRKKENTQQESIIKRLGGIFNYIMTLRHWGDCTAMVKKLIGEMMGERMGVGDVVAALRAPSRLYTEPVGKLELKMSQYRAISPETEAHLVEKRKKKSI